ncbi:MAG TPA: glycerol-3-phosphate 1-O-acyltransferase PlsY [Geminicoccus sp.]|jgi:glycerol-3-phosphate acyltransferase PlsY|uniref:glycerol-3-phosphate 1-O-acyltransferase PlsY n=1 Tax=Geminicoccus sp. TaxID=2024832 RepID=UPI002E34C51A|nr:glycerol-3-phosphate 1-O-acyltransferase PlsY [Geminicoccus sp.]HEX2527395.1 glycerol-3-phosphate 1-O-acyltransferase PlsY [Geminicoccus sp.]
MEPVAASVWGWPHLLGLILGYLAGSIPFGLILTRVGGAGDIRAIGSGNIGATNVLRTGRKGLALATLLFDAAKGAIPVLIADQLFGREMAVVVGLGAVIGHCFPVWLGFKGGKGVATAAGVVLAISPLTLLAALIVFLAAVTVTRFVSLGSVLASLTAALVAFMMGNQQATLLFAIIGIIVIVKHHQNIGRLVRGEESKVSFSKKA